MMFCLLQMFNATYIIFTSTEEAHLEGTEQVRQVRSRMTSTILVDFMTTHQISDEFYSLVLSIYEHVKSQPERSEEDTQPVDMEIRRLIVKSVLNTFTSLKDHVSDLDSVEMSPDNYKKLVDECYKLRKYESKPFRFAIKKNFYMYKYDDYYMNLIVGLIAIAYIDHANAFVYLLYENEDFRRTGAKQFFETTRCTNNLALAAFLTPHSKIIIKPIAFTELINENFNHTEMIQNLLTRQPTASDKLVHFYSLEALYGLVYGHVDPKQDDDDILKKIAEASASILNFNHMVSSFSRAGINQTNFFRNMTKVDLMKTYPSEITVPNIPDFAKFMAGTIQKLRLLIEVNKKCSSVYEMFLALIMDRKEYDNNVEKVKDITKCTDEIARKALSQATNLNDAIYIARNLMTKESYVGGGSSGLAVENAKKIVEYADGILVEETFYSYKDEKNLRLKSMLERKEFDAGLLGGNDDDNVSVMYVDRKNENYEKEEKKEPKKIVYPQVGESLNLPETMIIEDGDIKFKILTCDKRINVTMKSGTVKDVIKYIESQCKKKIILKSGNKILDENADVQTINRSMIVLEIKK